MKKTILMPENNHTRRRFLELFGLTAGMSLVSTNALAGWVDKEEIRRLTAKQQKFMLRYEKWMDEFVEVIRIKKTQPDNPENKSRMIALANQAEKFKPEINEFMKDATFSVIYKTAIERMSKEI
ncbi:MAG: hypothetical protein WAQ28_04395 [Bacteroidia bacterium]